MTLDSGSRGKYRGGGPPPSIGYARIGSLAWAATSEFAGLMDGMEDEQSNTGWWEWSRLAEQCVTPRIKWT